MEPELQRKQMESAIKRARGTDMPKLLLGSLKSRILLLAVVTCLFLAGAAFSFFSFLSSSHAATLSVEERHLVTVASNLARNYEDQVNSALTLRAQRPVPPPPPPHRNTSPPDSPPPPPRHSDPLTRLTEKSLQQEPGIEGGFYAAASDSLPGYAFPTHEGPGQNKEMPQSELPTIRGLAHNAVLSGSTKTFRFEAPHVTILFVAVPIREPIADQNGSPTPLSEISGAVWLMQRIPGSEGKNRQLLFGSIGFGAAALITALLALFVTTEVRSGVNAVLTRLNAVEGGLSGNQPFPESGSQLAEFDTVLCGIEALALSLQQKINNERALEAEMRHKERLSALGQFAAGIAHELRNPLATIRLRTQMSERSADDSTVVRNNTVVLEEIDRLDTIISRLLYFSRPIHLQLQTVALDELCSSAALAWRERELSKGIRISCDAHSGVVLMCDRNRILQVMDNLIENAIHASSLKNTGEVVITTAQHQKFAQIDVLDNGPGFAPDDLNHVLEPFFTTKETGTGLGLSISFEIVQAHGGELHLDNRAGGGAVASICLPVVSLPVDSSVRQRTEDNTSNG
jgi:signal transduction histidine kinase